MKRSKFIIFATMGFLLTLNIASASALTEQSEVDVQFTFNPFLTMTLSSADIIIPNLAPGTSANSNTVNIVVNTNNISGYNLSATVGNSVNNSRDLVHTNGSNKFDNINVGTSVASLTTDNTWGYSIDSGSHYSGLPIYSAANGAELKSTFAPAADDTTAFLIGAKAATSQVAGDYTNVINFVAVTNAAPIIMQNLDPSLCTTSAPTIVMDSRDGEEYKVQRLADGKCWLLDNLRLDLVAHKDDLNSTNTNASDTILGYLKNGEGSGQYPASGVAYSTDTDSYNLPYIAISGNCYNTNCVNNPSSGTWNKDAPVANSPGSGSGKVGVYYNYCAASAGSYCYASGQPTSDPVTTSGYDIGGDICPKGWRMPTGGTVATGTIPGGEYQSLYTAYSSNAADFKAALSTPLSGDFYNGSARDQGSSGYFWSATYDYINSMYFNVSSSNVYPRYSDYRYNGNSVRCVLST